MGIKSTLRYYRNILSDFNITIDDEIIAKIVELQDREIALDNYIKRLIKEKLSERY